MKNINNIINNIIAEATISRNNILDAIKEKKEVVVQKPFVSNDDQGFTSENVIMQSIDDNDIISGTTKDGEEIQFSIDDILSSLSEGIDVTNADTNTIKKINDAGGNKGISISSDKINNMDTAKVGELLKKADSAKVDINLTEQTDSFISEEENIYQLKSIENFINWTNLDPELEVSGQKQKGNNILNYTLFINHVPIEVYIYPEGILKIGGHVIKDLNTFNKIIAFYKDNK